MKVDAQQHGAVSRLLRRAMREGSGLRVLAQAGVRHLARRRLWRRGLNAMYRALPFERTASAHTLFAKLYDAAERAVASGEWIVDFAGRSVRLPLRADAFWLDWDLAMSVLGHETHIKAAYASLLRSSARPDLFLDVGANYGTHSLLFLVHGVEAISFEPNPSCHAYFIQACARNRVSPRIEAVALGSREGTVELTYPVKETWLGTTSNSSAEHRFDRRADCVRHQVPVRRLDDYLPGLLGRKALLKIDTEGGEADVLDGARETLRRLRPVIAFESWRGNVTRPALFAGLTAAGYRIAPLAGPLDAARPLDGDEFLQSPASDFYGTPTT